MNPNLYIFTDSVFKYTVNGIAKTTFNNPNLLKREIEKKYVAKKINDTIYIFYDPKKSSKEFEIVFRELKPAIPSVPIKASTISIAESTIKPQPAASLPKRESVKSKTTNNHTSRKSIESTTTERQAPNTDRMVESPFQPKK
jgi:hypothetical protein